MNSYMNTIKKKTKKPPRQSAHQMEGQMLIYAAIDIADEFAEQTKKTEPVEQQIFFGPRIISAVYNRQANYCVLTFAEAESTKKLKAKLYLPPKALIGNLSRLASNSLCDLTKYYFEPEKKIPVVEKGSSSQIILYTPNKGTRSIDIDLFMQEAYSPALFKSQTAIEIGSITCKINLALPTIMREISQLKDGEDLDLREKSYRHATTTFN